MLYGHRLTERQIRLLRIKLDTYRAPIRCQLVEASLDDLPSYEALSYVWGDLEVTERIFCNGEEVDVTVNLARALRRIRLGLSPPSADNHDSSQNHSPQDQAEEAERSSSNSVSGSKPRPYRPGLLWVDALCINQADMVERNAQVPLMGDIYSNATRVIIWLGDKKANMRLMSLAVAAVAHGIPAVHTWTPESVNAILHCLQNLNPDGWEGVGSALHAAFSSAWFHRVWCAQEAILARKTCLLYRNAELASRNAALLCTFLVTVYSLKPTLWSPTQLGSLFTLNTSQVIMRLSEDPFERYSPYTTFLSSAKNLQAADPRDKFYGFLGILGARVVDVDYNKSVAEVYIDSVLQTASHKLYVLSFVSHPLEYRSRGDLPSWVPEWNQPEKSFELPLALLSNDSDILAMASSKRQVSEVDSCLAVRGILKLPGLLCDRVIACSGQLGTGYDKHLHDVFLDLWDEVIVNRPASSISLLSWATTFTGNFPAYQLDPKGDPMDTELIRDFLAFTGELLAKDKRVVMGDVLGDDAPRGDAKAYAEWISQALQYRRSFRTHKSWLGLGPHCMRKGDVIAVFHGGYSPYVLRPIEGTPDHYHLMGECYVDNLTNEGAYVMLEEGGVEERVFYLV